MFLFSGFPGLTQVKRAIRAFKDGYFLDTINIEDEIDPDSNAEIPSVSVE